MRNLATTRFSLCSSYSISDAQVKLYTAGVRTLVSGNILVLLVVFILLNIFAPTFESFEQKTVDTRFRLRNSLNMNPGYSSALVHINLDNHSKQSSGLFSWPRSHYADLIRRISVGNAKALACDVMFMSRGVKTKSGDARLIDAVITATNVISPLILDFSHAASSATTLKNFHLDTYPLVKRSKVHQASRILAAPMAEIAEQSAALGFVNIIPDADGVVRRVRLLAVLDGALVPSFFLQAVAEYLDYDIENVVPVDGFTLTLKDFPVGVTGLSYHVDVPLDGQGNLVVNLAGPLSLKNYPQSYSAWDLLKAEQQYDFSGKLVFLADTSVEHDKSGDFSPVPLGRLFPRSYIFSNAANSLLNRDFIRPIGAVFTAVATVLLSILLVFVCWKSNTLVFSLAALSTIVLYTAGVLGSFLFGNWLLPVLPVLITVTAVYLFSGAWQHREYQDLAFVDGLTGLHNRRWLDKFLLRQLSRARVSGESLSVAMIDIDHFKKFNDTYGHRIGDFVLTSIADCFINSLRPTDLTARYGGEEFMVILPQTPGENAMIAANRVRETVSSLKLITSAGMELPTITISIGVAELTVNQSKEQLIEAADRALYTAKENGRNKVCKATV